MITSKRRRLLDTPPPPGNLPDAPRKGAPRDSTFVKTTPVTLPQLGLIAFTRALLGAGVALLLSDKLGSDQRRAVGYTLVGVGVLTTFPLLAEVFGRRNAAGRAGPANEYEPENGGIV